LKITNLDITYKNKEDLCYNKQGYETSYPTTINLNGFLTEPTFFTNEKLSEIPLFSDFLENDESYQTIKELPTLNTARNYFLTGVSTTNLAPQSYVTIFNNFRGGYTTPY